MLNAMTSNSSTGKKANHITKTRPIQCIGIWLAMSLVLCIAHINTLQSWNVASHRAQILHAHAGELQEHKAAKKQRSGQQRSGKPETSQELQEEEQKAGTEQQDKQKALTQPFALAAFL